MKYNSIHLRKAIQSFPLLDLNPDFLLGFGHNPENAADVVVGLGGRGQLQRLDDLSHGDERLRDRELGADASPLSEAERHECQARPLLHGIRHKTLRVKSGRGENVTFSTISMKLDKKMDVMDQFSPEPSFLNI